MAAEASGVIGAEGMLGALAMAVFTGFPVGTIIREDCKIKQTLERLKDYSIVTTKLHQTLHLLHSQLGL